MTTVPAMRKGRKRLTPERVAKLEDEANRLLERAAGVFDVPEAGRDEWLEAGRLLCHHVRKRSEAGVKRMDAVASAAKRLHVLPNRVYELTRVAASVEALSDGEGPGQLSYSSLRAFGLLYNSKAGRMKERVTEQAKEAFAKAAAEGWTAVDVQRAVWGLSNRRQFERRVVEGPTGTYVCNGRQSNLVRPDLGDPPGCGDGREGPGEGAFPQTAAAGQRKVNVYGKDGRLMGQVSAQGAALGRAAHTVSAVASAATPKDLAEMLLEIVKQSLDPPLVARLVSEGLAEAARGPDLPPRTFVGFKGDGKAEAWEDD